MSLRPEIDSSLAAQVRHLTTFLFPFFPQAVLAKIPQSQLLGTSEGKAKFQRWSQTQASSMTSREGRANVQGNERILI